jgi:hypothetical protein
MSQLDILGAVQKGVKLSHDSAQHSKVESNQEKNSLNKTNSFEINRGTLSTNNGGKKNFPAKNGSAFINTKMLGSI